MQVGSVLEGKYRLDAVIGEGGAAMVFRATHLGINKQVAIKVLHPDNEQLADASVDLQREALTSGQLDHPNIVAVSDLGVLPDGSLFLVMEMLEGESLGDRIAADQRIPWPEAIEIMRGLLAGLRHAHEHGVVHCDIKPDNVFLARKHGAVTVKILDFGIATLLAETRDLGGMTAGTTTYMSPEQATASAIGPATDLYSASIVLYEMLAGQPPFRHQDKRERMLAHVQATPPPFDPSLQLPPALVDIVMAGLAKSSADRLAPAGLYATRLEAVLRAAGLTPQRDAAAQWAVESTAQAPLAGYEVLQSIGRGGMAEVFLARQRGAMGFEKAVVLKRILPELTREPRFIEMFLDEARLAAKILDPHVAQIYELGLSYGTYYIAMEYIEGESLDAIVASSLLGQAPPSPHLVARIIAETAAGLHAAHELRDVSGRSLDVVHRDVTHSNILVMYSGAVKVVDFGIAKARTQLAPNANGELHGKPGYGSPEHVAGRAVDRRADVFSLGIVLWEALTRRSLFGSNDRIGKAPVPPPSRFAEIPRELDHIALHALATDPEDRFQTAEAMRVAIESFLLKSGAPAGALELSAYMRATFPERMAARKRVLEAIQGGNEVPTLARLPDAPRREPVTRLVTGRARPLVWIGAGVAAIAATGGGIYALHSRGEAAAPPPPHAIVMTAQTAPPAAPPDAAEADPLLDAAEIAIDGGRIASPPGENALDMLAEADRRHPGDPRVAALRTRALDALRTTAQVLWDNGKPDSARVVYADLLRFAPDDATARARATPPAHAPKPAKHRSHADPAVVAWLVTQIDLAIIERRFVAPEHHNALEYLIELRRVDPSNDASHRLGNEVANALAQEAAKQQPTAAKQLLDAASQARGEGSASATHKQAAGDAQPFLLQGNSLLAAGKFTDADAAFQKAISVDGSAHAAFAGIANVAFQQGDFPRALLSAKRAVALAPNSVSYRMTLAKCEYKLMRYDDAIRDWKKAVELDPSNETAKKNIAMANAKLGR